MYLVVGFRFSCIDFSYLTLLGEIFFVGIVPLDDKIYVSDGLFDAVVLPSLLVGSIIAGTPQLFMQGRWSQSSVFTSNLAN